MLRLRLPRLFRHASMGLLAATAAVPALGQTEFVYDLRITNFRVTIHPDGSKHVRWDWSLEVPAGMPAIPLRSTIWRLDASGNPTKIVWDEYHGAPGPDESGDYNCPNVNSCTQPAGECRNPGGGFCSVRVESPDKSTVTMNGNCVTHDFNSQGQGNCDAFECLCSVTGDPCTTAGGSSSDLPPARTRSICRSVGRVPPQPDGRLRGRPVHRVLGRGLGEQQAGVLSPASDSPGTWKRTGTQLRRVRRTRRDAPRARGAGRTASAAW